MGKLDINEKLWDYLICLENAIKSLNEKYDYKSVSVADSNDLLGREIETLTRVEKDLRWVVDDLDNKTYWDYFDDDEHG